MFLHLSPAARDRYSLHQVQDLFEQAKKVAYKPFTSRLPYECHDDFHSELSITILKKWQTKPFDPKLGSLGNWLHHQAWQTFRDFTRKRQRQLDRELQMFDRGSYYDVDNRKRMLNEDWLWAHVQTVAVHQQKNSVDEPDVSPEDVLLEAISRYIPLTEVEKDVLSFKRNKCSMLEIAEVMDMHVTDIRKAAHTVNAKVEAAKAIIVAQGKPCDSVVVAAEDQDQNSRFPSVAFDVSIERLGDCGQHSGLKGMRRAIELHAGATAVGKKCNVAVRLDTGTGSNAKIIRDDYGPVIRKCSSIKIWGGKIGGPLSTDEPGADLVWALMLGDACTRRTLRATTAFDPTVRDFRLIAANMRTMGVADDPVFSTAVRCWEARL